MSVADELRKIQSSGAVFSKPSSGLSGNASRDVKKLYKLATKNGLQNDANRILKNTKGEEINKIFSGGFVSDVFDVLNALQYGVTGVLQGKGFGEGVKTRASFSDKDSLGESGLPGVIGGLALDIAVDPLTYIAPWTIAKKIPGAVKVAQAAKRTAFGEKVTKNIVDKAGKAIKTYETMEGGTKAGRYLAEKFSWMFGADPIYKQTWERSVRNIGVSTQNVADTAKKIVKLPDETAAKLLTTDKNGRIKRVGLDALKGSIGDEDYKLVEGAWKQLDDLGQQAVDVGLLSKEKYEEGLGEYIKNAYTEYEIAQKKGLFGTSKAGVKGIKSRVSQERLASGYLKKLTFEEVKKSFPKALDEVGNISLKKLSDSEINDIAKKSMENLGQIKQPGYLLFKSSFDLIRDIENTKLFNAVADKFGSDVAQTGMKQLPKGQRLGKVAGMYVPENIYNHLTDITEPIAETFGKKLMATFKYNKVIMNPATHARNITSNTILNWWKLGLGPWRADIYSEAVGQVMKGGKWADEAKKVGYNIDTFAANELRGLLDTGEANKYLKGLGGAGAKIKSKLADMYQSEENIAKMAAYIFSRKKGMGTEEAWKAAESATFNYAQVTPFIRKMRTSLFGMPFVTFAVKSTPVAVETILKNPGRISIFGKIKNDIENAADIETTARERASEPNYIKNGFYIKLPIKDSKGRSAYFDLTYIIPFGDLVSGGLFQRQTSRETGLKESIPETALSNLPVIQFIKEISKNQDFYGDKIWRDSDTADKQMGDLMRHLTKTMAPPLLSDQLPGGHMAKGGRRIKGVRGAITSGGENQQRTLMQELLRNVGAKVQPVNVDIQEYYQDANRKKGLENLLIENNILGQFDITYNKD